MMMQVLIFNKSPWKSYGSQVATTISLPPISFQGIALISFDLDSNSHSFCFRVDISNGSVIHIDTKILQHLCCSISNLLCIRRILGGSTGHRPRQLSGGLIRVTRPFSWSIAMKRSLVWLAFLATNWRAFVSLRSWAASLMFRWKRITAPTL